MTGPNFLCMCQRWGPTKKTWKSHLAILAWCFPFSIVVLTLISSNQTCFLVSSHLLCTCTSMKFLFCSFLVLFSQVQLLLMRSAGLWNRWHNKSSEMITLKMIGNYSYFFSGCMYVCYILSFCFCTVLSPHFPWFYWVKPRLLLMITSINKTLQNCFKKN